jgi:hypothetical protein
MVDLTWLMVGGFLGRVFLYPTGPQPGDVVHGLDLPCSLCLPTAMAAHRFKP